MIFISCVKKCFNSSKSIEDQRYLENVYFERLTDYAEGNIVAAMNYWLNSIKKIDGNTPSDSNVQRVSSDRPFIPRHEPDNGIAYSNAPWWIEEITISAVAQYP
jgi:hypothetical protein